MKKRIIIYFCLLSLIGLSLKIERSHTGDFVTHKQVNLGPIIVYEYRDIPPSLMCLDCSGTEQTRGFPFAYLKYAWFYGSKNLNPFNIFYLTLNIIIYFIIAFMFSGLICLTNRKLLTKKSMNPPQTGPN